MEKIIDVKGLLAKNLVRLRQNRGLSQLALANEADLGVAFVNDLEHGRKWVSPTTIEKLCSTLKVEPYQLFISDNDSVADKDKAVAECCDDFLLETGRIVGEIRKKYLAQR